MRIDPDKSEATEDKSYIGKKANSFGIRRSKENQVSSVRAVKKNVRTKLRKIDPSPCPQMSALASPSPVRADAP